ncbi:TonB-dependent receptor [uncultured Sphingomonas sp.]|uniref:TonB-dependent receptor n=1 Tax=uncultured Sphingomonas sp. TaxID=158754 RepID=UPI0025E2D04F|nr:TonB-dependent receptor [uncultured Sphingomonas sp.]
MVIIRALGITAALLCTTSALAQSDVAPQADTPPSGDAGTDIVVTATRRASPLANVPVAVSAVDARRMAESGATDIRQLNQLVPSLLVSSTSSEAGGGGARIRGIGTVGDNAGLESSVATFVDGVYRNRAAVALTELGPLERVEVLRGPQSTLFGRNASAGIINIVTANPEFTQSGYGEASIGNYDYRRFAAGLTGPLFDNVAYRIDGVLTKRRGFVEELASGRHINNRDRWLARGKLLFRPHDGLSLLLSADYSHRDEECCAGPYRPTADVVSSTPGQPGGTPIYRPSSIEAIITGFTSAVPGADKGRVETDTFARKVVLTPGRSFRQDVEDYGTSAELNLDIGGAHLTSISAYRGNRFIKGQDADFSSLDLTVRPDDGSGFTRFRTFTQEVRLQGQAFAGRLDWLVGGYLADEHLTYVDNNAYGADFEAFAAARIAAAGPIFSAFPRYGFGNLSGFARAFSDAQLATSTVPAASRGAVADAVAGAVRNVALNGTGQLDRFRQHDRNLALFTHNIVRVTDRLSLTLGARYTDDRKSVDASLVSTSGCGAYAANLARLRALAASAAANPGGNGGLNSAIAGVSGALANQALGGFAGLACVVNSVQGDFDDDRHEKKWTGTAVLSWKPTERIMTYASFARGYKGGGFNLDRAQLFNTATLAQQPFESLQFKPETVDAWELGAKYAGGAVTLNAALFYQRFRNFQLNTFNGLNFIVSNIQSCKDDLGGRDADAVAGNSACDDTRSGVVSKGLELEGSVRPVRDVTLTAGFTYADTRYRHGLVGTPDRVTGDNSLPPALFLLPGSRLSNAPKYVATGSAGWTPAIGHGLRGLAYADIRYTSQIHTGSDLFPEKDQTGVAVVNARIGIGRVDGGWSLELWAQNLFDANYIQTGFNMPLQGGGSGGVPGTVGAVRAFGTTSSQLLGAFLGEPRTWGLTARTKF